MAPEDQNLDPRGPRGSKFEPGQAGGPQNVHPQGGPGLTLRPSIVRGPRPATPFKIKVSFFPPKTYKIKHFKSIDFGAPGPKIN